MAQFYFLWLNNIPLHICTIISLSIHLLMDIEICYWFHALPTGHKCWNKNWGDMDLFELWFSPALGPVVGLLSHMVALSSVQSPSHVQIIAILWTAACQAALSITNSQSLLKLMSIDLVMQSNYLNLWRPLLLLLLIFSSIRVFPNESGGQSIGASDSQHLFFCRFFDDGHSDWCEVWLVWA